MKTYGPVGCCECTVMEPATRCIVAHSGPGHSAIRNMVRKGLITSHC